LANCPLNHRPTKNNPPKDHITIKNIPVELPHTLAVEDTPEEDTPAVDTRRHNCIHQSKYQLSLSPLEKKPTYETKTHRNQEEEKTHL